LAVIVAHCPDSVDARVLFFRPTNFADNWEKTDLWFSANEIPNVIAVSDENGIEASKFGATTSGYSMLYDSSGKLLFRGGITGSRGHSGDNAGRSAIESLLMNKVTDQKQSFVFGCPLFGEADKHCQED